MHVWPNQKAVKASNLTISYAASCTTPTNSTCSRTVSNPFESRQFRGPSRARDDPIALPRPPRP
jgi:hypothetical protein